MESKKLERLYRWQKLAEELSETFDFIEKNSGVISISICVRSLGTEPDKVVNIPTGHNAPKGCSKFASELARNISLNCRNASIDISEQIERNIKRIN